jgi:ribosomal protein L37AE/L43A
MSRGNNNNKVEYKQYQFSKCETCGKYPALFRWYNKKCECTECAKKSFAKYMAALVAGTAVLVISFLVI